MPPNSLVFAIDDDASVRKGLARLLRSAAYKSEIFESASDFLARPPHSGPSCVIVDVQMPGLNGIELQVDLIRRHHVEQADRRSTWYGGEDSESSPWPGDGEARCRLGGRACAVGAASAPCAGGNA